MMDREVLAKYNSVTVPYISPLPRGFALACPLCAEYKMRPFALVGITGYRCCGPSCGHWMNTLQVEKFIGMRMVEE